MARSIYEGPGYLLLYSLLRTQCTVHTPIPYSSHGGGDWAWARRDEYGAPSHGAWSMVAQAAGPQRSLTSVRPSAAWQAAALLASLLPSRASLPYCLHYRDYLLVVLG